MAIPTVKQLLFWWIVPQALLPAQYQQSQAAQLMLFFAAGMMSSPRITDEASSSHLPSAVRHNDCVWSEVNLNLNWCIERGVVEQRSSRRQVLPAFDWAYFGLTELEHRGLSDRSADMRTLQKHCHLQYSAVTCFEHSSLHQFVTKKMI